MIELIRKTKNFWQKTNSFIEFLDQNQKNDFKNNDQSSEKVLIYLAPWSWTTVPFYSIALSLLISKKKKLTYLYDDLWGGDSVIDIKIQSIFIRKVLKRLPNVIILSSVSEDQNFYDDKRIENIAKLNSIHHNQGEQRARSDASYQKRIIPSLQKIYIKLNKLLDNEKWSYILSPGGVYGGSGVLTCLAQEKKIRFATYDSGESNEVMFCSSGISAKLQDIPQAFKKLIQEDFNQRIYEESLNEINKRIEGTSVFSYQGKSSSLKDLFSNSVLISLNVSWDSAALGLHQAFSSTDEWIIESTRWLLENTDKKIIIRQHPVEKYEFAASTDNYKKILEQAFGQNDRVVFISCFDDTNSYDLLKVVDLTLVYTSTFAIESVIAGVPVVTESSCYYHDLGFIKSAKTREQYFSAIKMSMGATVSEEMKRNAVICYYLTQICNWSFSNFNPCAGFNEWTLGSIDDLVKDKEIQRFIKSIDKAIPFSYSTYQDNLKSVPL